METIPNKTTRRPTDMTSRLGSKRSSDICGAPERASLFGSSLIHVVDSILQLVRETETTHIMHARPRRLVVGRTTMLNRRHVIHQSHLILVLHQHPPPLPDPVYRLRDGVVSQLCWQRSERRLSER